MAKISSYLFATIIICIIAIVIVQLSSIKDTQDFYRIMDTIIKVALGAWGGTKWSMHEYTGDRNERA